MGDMLSEQQCADARRRIADRIFCSHDIDCPRYVRALDTIDALHAEVAMWRMAHDAVVQSQNDALAEAHIIQGE